MSPEVIPSDHTHWDSHPSLYEGNHPDYYFSLLPIGVPIPFLTIPNGDSWWDPILSFKALYILHGVYQVSESTHS